MLELFQAGRMSPTQKTRVEVVAPIRLEEIVVRRTDLKLPLQFVVLDPGGLATAGRADQDDDTLFHFIPP
jgi:hypothetical protein